MQTDKMKVKKIKVATLTGELLDYWVAKAQNICVHKNTEDWIETGPIYEHEIYTRCLDCKREEVGHELKYSPSTDWSQGGPIIEREGIRWQPMPNDKYISWVSRAMENEGRFNAEYGSTLLEAAMRAFVTFKFGEEVEE